MKLTTEQFACIETSERIDRKYHNWLYKVSLSGEERSEIAEIIEEYKNLNEHLYNQLYKDVVQNV